MAASPAFGSGLCLRAGRHGGTGPFRLVGDLWDIVGWELALDVDLVGVLDQVSCMVSNRCRRWSSGVGELERAVGERVEQGDVLITGLPGSICRGPKSGLARNRETVSRMGCAVFPRGQRKHLRVD